MVQNLILDCYLDQIKQKYKIEVRSQGVNQHWGVNQLFYVLTSGGLYSIIYRVTYTTVFQMFFLVLGWKITEKTKINKKV